MEQINCNTVIVILNYLNWQDTIECITSVFDMNYSITGVVVVDNGSNNESYKILQDQYANNQKVYVLNTQKNDGFARGNNFGIDFARKKLKAEFVLCVNNDTVFIDKDYINKLLNAYKNRVGVIGSKIILKNGKMQPCIKAYLGVKDTFFEYINAWSYARGSSFDFPVHQEKSTMILHGCALMFTPDFFKYYKGFYERTFLYGEEMILKLMCEYKGLSQVYVDDTSIFHKEDQSSELSFNNDSKIKALYTGKSRKYIFYWSLKNSIFERESINNEKR